MSNKSFVELLLCQPLPSDEERRQLNQLVEREVAKSKLPERMHRFDVADVVLMAFSLGKIQGIRQERQKRKSPASAENTRRVSPVKQMNNIYDAGSL